MALKRKLVLKKKQVVDQEIIFTAPVIEESNEKAVVGPPIPHPVRKPLVVKRQHVEQALSRVPELILDSIETDMESGTCTASFKKETEFKSFENILEDSDEIKGFEYIVKQGRIWSPSYNYHLPIEFISLSKDKKTLTLKFNRVLFEETKWLWLKGINNLRRHLRFVLSEMATEGIYIVK